MKQKIYDDYEIKKINSTLTQLRKLSLILGGLAFYLVSSSAQAFLDKFTSAPTSKISSVLSFNSSPLEIFMKIGQDIPRGGKNALLNVNFRRPYLHLTEIPSELIESFKSDPSKLESFSAFLKSTYPQLTDKELNLETLTENFYVIGNFAHGMFGYNSAQEFLDKEPGDNTQSRYWLALIPKEVKPTQMNLQIETFSGGEGKHMQIRADLDSPIVLIPQPQISGQSFENIQWSQILDKTNTPSPEDAIGLPFNNPILIRGNLIYGLMANSFQEGPKEASFTNGITGYLAIGMILASQTHMALDQLPRGSFLRDYKLSMNESQRRTLLNYILTPNYLSPVKTISPDTFMLPAHYNTVFYNCINAALEAINVGLTNNNKNPQKSINIYQFNPFVVPEYLMENNIISDRMVVQLNTLPQYSAITKAKTETVLKLAQDFRELMYSTALDAMVRQFAYQVTSKGWSSHDVDYVIALASEAPTKILTKGLRKLAISKLIKSQDSLNPKLSSIKIVEIATAMDQIIKRAIKSGSWEFTKKKIINPIYNLQRKFIGLLGLARIS